MCVQINVFTKKSKKQEETISVCLLWITVFLACTSFSEFCFYYLKYVCVFGMFVCSAAIS